MNICAGQVAALGAKLAPSRARASGSGLASSVPWWRNAVMYEVYLRSFADGDGDGIGDIPGLRSRLPYLRDLGVDGILVTPWYPSPMKDGGYDVSSYTGIDPLFGTLADARELIDDAHRNDLKVVVDFVANHTSDQHPWFKRALAAAPGSGRARYHFRDGKGPGRSDPPNDWISAFGGSAWTQIIEPDGIPGQWYLHLFSPAQPDLNWDNLEVRSDFESILRFWFDFGLDGLRIDAASGFAKDPALPDFGFAAGDIFQPVKWTGSPLWDVEGVHDILRSWRAIADSYDGERMFVGEVVVNGPQRLARYMRPGELHTTFNLDFLKSPLDPGQLRQVIDSTTAAFGQVGAPAAWVLSSHDETRHVTRYGRASTGVPVPPPYPFPPCDRALGTRRARAMLMLLLALPGLVFLYQGEELGLWEIENLPDGDIHDPVLGKLGTLHSRPRRLPDPAAVVRNPAPVRLYHPRREAMAAPASPVERLHGRSRNRPRGLDAELVPRRPPHPPHPHHRTRRAPHLDTGNPQRADLRPGDPASLHHQSLRPAMPALRPRPHRQPEHPPRTTTGRCRSMDQLTATQNRTRREPEHVRRGDLDRFLPGHREERLQVDRHRPPRVRPAPARHELQIPVHQPVAQPVTDLARPDTKRARHGKLLGLHHPSA